MSKLTKIVHIGIVSMICALSPLRCNGQDFGKYGSLFSLLSPSKTGIYFKNNVTDSKEANILVYEAFYEGGGVAIGDINNDGLPDIYFTGNQVGDKLYLNEGNLKFKDITETSGIVDKGGWSTGVNMIDINGDGYKDIFVCKSLYDERPDLRQNELYINNGDLTFTESAKQYQLNDPWRAIHANFFDYDKDGDFDLFLINQPPNPSILSPMVDQNYLNSELTYRFLENKNGSFIDITKKSGLENVGYGLSSVTADFNNDQWPDLYVANDYEGPDFMYINNQDGTFSNKIDDYLKHISFFSMGSDAGDINNDGLLDLMVVDMVAEDNYRIKSNMSGMDPDRFWQTVELGGHYQYMFNTLQLNRGEYNDKQLFSEIGQFAGISNTDWSWAPLLADFNNDGFKDLFVTNGIKRDVRNTDALKKLKDYINEEANAFTKDNSNAGDVSIWEIVDLNKLLSFFPQEKLVNYTFRNNGSLGFEKVMSEWGLDQLTFSSGAAYGDLDDDGDLDLVVNNVDDFAYVYKNNSNKRSGNNFLKIKFKSGDKHPSFFGTRATIYYDGQIQVGELTSARGFFSSSEEAIHFGLGETKKIDSLLITWYNGGQSVLRKVKTGQTLVLDREKLKQELTQTPKPNQPRFFKDITEESGITFEHVENIFDDYEREILLPHKMSVLGPGLAIGDVDSNGFEDFFIGGSVGKSGKVFLQQKDGSFTPGNTETYTGYLYHEDMGAEFFDADMDGDLDLYVVSGGNEYDMGINLYQDRFYINDGKGNFSLLESALPLLHASGGRVKPMDYDKDGDIDLFICGRQVPGRYPEPAESYLLINKWKETGTISFDKVDNKDLKDLGMVTDAIWSDHDKDGDLDIIVVGEWMPLTILDNHKGEFKKKALSNSLKNTTGWWYSIESADLDGDGDEDYVLGNLGLNYKYKASQEEPFTVNYDDFDQNGKNDIVLGYYNYGEHYPLRGRSCSSQQVPELKNAFPTYNIFASANLTEVYGAELLDQSLEYKAHMFESVCLENLGNGEFNIHKLPVIAQLSSINDIIMTDVDKDGNTDLIAAGNMYGSEIETTRNDAGVGLFLKGNGDCTFDAIPMSKSGLCLPYDVKALKPIRLASGNGILVGVNDGPVRIVKF